MSTTFLDLKGCHSMLEQRLGASAPSYVTMRRWADAGVFMPIQDAATGRRVRYEKAAMLKLVRDRLTAKNARKSKPPRPAKVVASHAPQEATLVPAAPLEIGHLEDLLKDIADRQVRLESMLEETLSVSKNLDAIRKMLMVKYEGAHTANVELIQQLKARLRSAEDVQSDMKITITLNRIADRISDLERELRRKG